MDGLGGLILTMVVLMGVMYLLTIRPQRKQLQEQEKAISQLQPGSRVLLANGMFATLREAGKDQMIVELAPGVEVAVLRQIVRRPVADDEEEFEFVDDAQPADEVISDEFEVDLAAQSLDPAQPPEPSAADAADDSPHSAPELEQNQPIDFIESDDRKVR